MGFTPHLKKDLIIGRIAKDGLPRPAAVHLIDRAPILNVERSCQPESRPLFILNSQPKTEPLFSGLLKILGQGEGLLEATRMRLTLGMKGVMIENKYLGTPIWNPR